MEASSANPLSNHSPFVCIYIPSVQLFFFLIPIFVVSSSQFSLSDSNQLKTNYPISILFIPLLQKYD